MSSIHASQVVLPDGPRAVRVAPATIDIEGHSIVAVREGVRDGTLVEGLVAPAFVNAHTHLAMSAFRGIGGVAAMRGNVVEDLYFRLESTLEPEDVRAFATVALAEGLLAGVGTVWDHYYHGRALAEAAAEVGTTAVIAPTLQDLDGPGVPHLEAQLDATVALATDQALREQGIVAALGPHATDTVSAALFDRIADLATRHALPLHLHAAQSIEEVRRSLSRHGRRPVQWLRERGWLDAAPAALLVHVLYADRAELDGLDPDRIALGHCPASQIQYCFPAYLAGWRALGQRVVIGTDCGACNDGMNVQQELRLAAGGPLYGVASSPSFQRFWEGRGDAETVATVREGLQGATEVSPAQLLAMVFHGPGSLHPDLRVGAIAPGHRANLVVHDTTHPSFWPATDPLRALAFQDTAPAIRRMMLNGVWRSADGDHQRTILEAGWFRSARRHADERLERFLR